MKLFAKRGFTLIELLVVISIIALLSSIVLASLNEAREKAKMVVFQTNFLDLKKALEIYKLDNGEYPYQNSDPSGYMQQALVMSEFVDEITPILTATTLGMGGNVLESGQAGFYPEYVKTILPPPAGQGYFGDYTKVLFYHGNSLKSSQPSSGSLVDATCGGQTVIDKGYLFVLSDVDYYWGVHQRKYNLPNYYSDGIQNNYGFYCILGE